MMLLQQLHSRLPRLLSLLGTVALHSLAASEVVRRRDFLPSDVEAAEVAVQSEPSLVEAVQAEAPKGAGSEARRVTRGTCSRGIS